MAGIQEDDTQIRDPNSDGVVQSDASRAGERMMPSGSQEAIGRYTQPLVEGLPLRRADRFEQPPVSRRKAEPRKLHDPIGTLDIGGAQMIAA